MAAEKKKEEQGKEFKGKKEKLPQQWQNNEEKT